MTGGAPPVRAGVRYDEDIVEVSIVGLGMRSHAGVAAQMFRILADEAINIQAISTSEIKISCLVATSTPSWRSAPCTTASVLVRRCCLEARSRQLAGDLLGSR